MQAAATHSTIDYEQALETLHETDASYGGGLSNHGPMAVEALVHLGVPHWIGPFLDHYRPRLESSRSQIEPAPSDWSSWLGATLPDLVPSAGNLAGHGLLRVAHAVRALERAEVVDSMSLAHRRELGAAVEYWSGGGPGVPGPQALTGDLDPAAWLQTLGRLPAEQRSEGLLTATFDTVATAPDFEAKVAALAPTHNAITNLDALGRMAAEAFIVNRGTSAFALLHGTTVPSMATVLVAYLDAAATRQLEAAVASFVAAAVIGFDAPQQDAVDAVWQIRSPHDLAEWAGATREDHTIKFVDACLDIASRSGDLSILRAAQRQIAEPYGLVGQA